jgi:hypothetical protein
MIVFTVLFVVLVATAAHAKDDPSQVIDRARDEARKVAPEAKLVHVEFSAFGFATGQSGIPDMTREGPPKAALFHFLAPHVAIRVFIRMNRAAQYSPETFRTLKERGLLAKDVEVERLPEPDSPYMWPLPDTVSDLDHAIATARAAAASDCVNDSACRLAQVAELRMHWNERGDAARPVWRITFGQNPRTLKSVKRDVEARTGRLISDEMNRSSFTELDQQPEPFRDAILRVGRSFTELWPAVNDAVQTRDPRYKPYAATLVTHASANTSGSGGVLLFEAHVRFARETPSWMWDDLEAHVTWRADTQAALVFSKPERLRGPRYVVPITTDPRRIPPADATLKSLVDRFPSGYAEESWSFDWDDSCRDLYRLGNLIHYVCGEYRVTQHQSDRIYLWLSRQDNPMWAFGVRPIASEYQMVNANAPKDTWTWWTRVKHASYWHYIMTDGMTGAVRTQCTAPNDGQAPIKLLRCP